MELSDLLTATPHDRLVYAVEAMLAGEFGEPIRGMLRCEINGRYCYCFDGALCEVWQLATAKGSWDDTELIVPFYRHPFRAAPAPVQEWFGLSNPLAGNHDEICDEISDLEDIEHSWSSILAELAKLDPALDAALRVALARREQAVG